MHITIHADLHRITHSHFLLMPGVEELDKLTHLLVNGDMHYSRKKIHLDDTHEVKLVVLSSLGQG